MSFDYVSNGINSAIDSASLGLQGASNNITKASFNIAQRSAESTKSQHPQGFLAHGPLQQSPGLSADIVNLSVNSTNAQASAKVLAVASGTLGTLLDIRV